MARNALVEYFDLRPHRRSVAQPRGAAPSPPPAPVIPQYVALVAGIVAQPYLEHYANTQGDWHLTFHDIAGRVIFGLLIGFAIFPAVYKNAFDPSRPLFVQLGAIFSIGLGWQSLIHLGGKVLGSP